MKKGWFVNTGHSPIRSADLEGGEGIRCDVKDWHFHIIEEITEVFWVQNNVGKGLVPDTLP